MVHMPISFLIKKNVTATNHVSLALRIFQFTGHCCESCWSAHLDNDGIKKVGNGSTYTPISGVASGKYSWKNSMTSSPVVIFSKFSKDMKSVQVNVLSCSEKGNTNKNKKPIRMHDGAGFWSLVHTVVKSCHTDQVWQGNHHEGISWPDVEIVRLHGKLQINGS